MIEKSGNALLAPISTIYPCGESLRYTPVYDAIREARRADDDSLSQGVWQREYKKADWVEVASLCQAALQDQSKDLQIAVWWLEARLHLEGLAGLAQGFETVLGLTSLYWESLYPQEENDLRVKLYEWMDARLSTVLPSIPVSHATESATPSLTFLDWKEAKRLDHAVEKGEIIPGEQSFLTGIATSLAQTPTAYYCERAQDCIQILATLHKLEGELQHRLGEGAPSFYRMREQLGPIQQFFSHLLEERERMLLPSQEEVELPECEELVVSSPSLPQVQEPLPTMLLESIGNREQAYAILGELATFLETIEPHSPTPYLIRRAVAWGDMNLSQLVSGMIQEGGDLSLLLALLNIKGENATGEGIA